MITTDDKSINYNSGWAMLVSVIKATVVVKRLTYSFSLFLFVSISWNSRLRHCAVTESSCALFPETLLTSATRTGMNEGKRPFNKGWRDD